MRAVLASLVQAMRPHQWVKNLLLFAPLVFAHELGNPEKARAALLAFAVFCALSSGVYLLNDVVDRKADARHPTKRERPIAAGRLPVAVALVAVAALWAGGLLGAWFVREDRGLLAWSAAYLALNLGYSFFLKRLVIVDGICIALGFQIRVHAGAVAIAAKTSSWILLCTFFFALFLAFCKRREEVARVDDASGSTRATMRDYEISFLDQLIAPLAALSILSYALYTVDQQVEALHGERIKYTVPFVVFGVFRYLFLVHRRGEGADPARLLFRDPQLVASGLLWGLTVWWAIATNAP
jgi:4-hydroxybenzoate polyprenyltransferase